MAHRHDGSATFRVRVNAHGDRLSDVRRALTSWARGQGLPGDVVQSVELATYEAMANVAQHAYRDGVGELQLRATAYPDRLHVTVADHGRWRAQGHKPDGGMGRDLIHGLADHAEITTGDDGTTVSMTWFRPHDTKQRPERLGEDR